MFNASKNNSPYLSTKIPRKTWDFKAEKPRMVLFKNKEYSSATAALDAYISDFEGRPLLIDHGLQWDQVEDLLRPRSTDRGGLVPSKTRGNEKLQVPKQKQQTSVDVQEALDESQKLLQNLSLDNLSSLPGGSELLRQQSDMGSYTTDMLLQPNMIPVNVFTEHHRINASRGYTKLPLMSESMQRLTDKHKATISTRQSLKTALVDDTTDGNDKYIVPPRESTTPKTMTLSRKDNLHHRGMQVHHPLVDHTYHKPGMDMIRSKMVTPNPVVTQDPLSIALKTRDLHGPTKNDLLLNLEKKLDSVQTILRDEEWSNINLDWTRSDQGAGLHIKDLTPSPAKSDDQQQVNVQLRHRPTLRKNLAASSPGTTAQQLELGSRTGNIAASQSTDDMGVSYNSDGHKLNLKQRMHSTPVRRAGVSHPLAEDLSVSHKMRTELDGLSSVSDDTDNLIRHPLFGLDHSGKPNLKTNKVSFDPLHTLSSNNRNDSIVANHTFNLSDLQDISSKYDDKELASYLQYLPMSVMNNLPPEVYRNVLENSKQSTFSGEDFYEHGVSNAKYRDYLKKLMHDIECSSSSIVTLHTDDLAYDHPLRASQLMSPSQKSGNSPGRGNWLTETEDEGWEVSRSNHSAGEKQIHSDEMVFDARDPDFLNRVRHLMKTDLTNSSRGGTSSVARAGSPDTEVVLEGDRSWEKPVAQLNFPRYVTTREGAMNTAVVKEQKVNIVDQFLRDCLQTTSKNEDEELTLTLGSQPGGMEALKNMLFAVQSLTPDGDKTDEQQVETV